ncbi:MAG: hypothetical protein Nkreftii_000171 [Candidatus Nitrospira kreftii]|uniref:Uncharacterized protein n=1 Tax=Candidatus Nitrospira kreftii TaxID=2652173 RepID=A0A7S8FAV5_9BACT|nr:MAG: hypothetical protein Nkreftii_000171 [Candidatus Nitrospira kreftii]
MKCEGAGGNTIGIMREEGGLAALPTQSQVGLHD